MDNDFRKDLDLIRQTLGAASTDDEAAAMAIRVLADHLREGRLVLTREDLARAMTNYGTYCASMAAGERCRIIEGDNGEHLIERTGEPLPASDHGAVH